MWVQPTEIWIEQMFSLQALFCEGYELEHKILQNITKGRIIKSKDT